MSRAAPLRGIGLMARALGVMPIEPRAAKPRIDELRIKNLRRFKKFKGVMEGFYWFSVFRQWLGRCKVFDGWKSTEDTIPRWT